MRNVSKTKSMRINCTVEKKNMPNSKKKTTREKQENHVKSTESGVQKNHIFTWMSNEFNLFFLLSFRFRLFRLFVKQYFIILYTYIYSSFSWLCLMLVVISIIISVENFRFWHVRVYILLYCAADVFFFNGAAAAFLWIFIMIVIVVYVSAHSECDVSLLTSLCVDVDKRLSFFRFCFSTCI